MIRAPRPHCCTEYLPAFINYLVCHHKLELFAVIECCATIGRRNFFTFFQLTLDNLRRHLRWQSEIILQSIIRCMPSPFYSSCCSFFPFPSTKSGTLPDDAHKSPSVAKHLTRSAPSTAIVPLKKTGTETAEVTFFFRR